MSDSETPRQAAEAALIRWAVSCAWTPWTPGDERRFRETVAAGDALAGLVPQLLEQLDNTEADLADHESVLAQLGERCHQLDKENDELRSALRWIRSHDIEDNCDGDCALAMVEIARAALGDAATPPEKDDEADVSASFELGWKGFTR